MNEGKHLQEIKGMDQQIHISLISILSNIDLFNQQCFQLEDILLGVPYQKIYEKYFPILGQLILPEQISIRIGDTVCRFSEINVIRKTLKDFEEFRNYLFEDSYQIRKNMIYQNLVENENDYASKFKFLSINISLLVKYFPLALGVPSNDLLSLSMEHEDWKVLKPFIEIVSFGKEEEIKASMKRIAKFVNIATASVDVSSQQKYDLLKEATLYAGTGFFFLFEKKANLRSLSFATNLDKRDATKVWNMPEHGLIKLSLSLIFPAIKFHKVLYAERTFMPITTEYILSQMAINGFSYPTPGANPIYQPLKPLRRESVTKKGDDKVKIRLLACNSVTIAGQAFQRNIYERINSYVFDEGFFEMFNTKELDKRSVIVHIHGGGFVSMSSHSHQNYTRKWANLTQTPILSIDYRKAPEYPYPCALDDVWQAYLWIVYRLSDYTDLATTKIVLTGDSAGGNLAMALTQLLIKYGLRVPDGILLSYPALNLDLNQFSPSYLYALNEPILNFPFLDVCLKSYVPEIMNSAIDPLLSPIKASHEVTPFIK